MSRELVINASLPETRIAMLEDGQIQDLLIERASDQGVVGNIYKGRVTRVLPGMQAAFVDIGLEKAAFLYVDDVHISTEAAEEIEDEVDGVEEELEAGAGEEGDEGETELEASADPEGETAEDEAGEAEDEVPGDPAEEETENKPEEMAAAPTDKDGDDAGTVAPEASGDSGASGDADGNVAEASADGAADGNAAEGNSEQGRRGGRNRWGRNRGRGKRGRGRGGRGRDRTPQQRLPDNYYNTVGDAGAVESDRADLSSKEEGRPFYRRKRHVDNNGNLRNRRGDFRQRRQRDRRIRSKSSRPSRHNVNIQDLLSEGQEVIVQVAKEPIAGKGARLTCHVSLAGRHLVCMPTIDHIGVSRRIERDDERRRLRALVEEVRPKKMGFIVRTASGGSESEEWISHDINYLSKLWDEIRGKAADASAPAVLHQDLNPILRAIRDWVSEDVSKIIIDSKEHYDELKEFVADFMPSMSDRVEHYQGDITIFDAYGVSTDLHRALERKVWLKSGGYLVIDQAEALVAVDVNTGRFVGKKNLEDTILKTNLEAVAEVAYQMRLRNCGGIIIIDLIDMERPENRYKVVRALEDAIKKDRARPSIVKISELGLIEMTRKRTRDTLVRSLCQSCSYCEGKGFIKSNETVAYEVMREIEREGRLRDIKKIMIQAHPDVIDILAIEHRDTLDRLEKKYRKEVYLQAVNDYHREQFDVSGDRTARPPARRDERRPSDRRSQRSNRGRRGHGNRSRGRKSEDSGKAEASQSADNDVNNNPGDQGLDTPNAEASDAAISKQNSENQEVGEDMENILDGRPVGDQKSPAAAGPGVSEEEEDRLAFLRAQAAQDAAIAGYGKSDSASPSQNNSRRGRRNNRRGSGGNSGRGGFSAGGGQGSGRGRYNNNRRGGGRNTRGASGRNGGRGYYGNRDRQAKQGDSASASASASESKESSSSGQSTPPAV